MAHHNELGKIGEKIALDYLLSKGFKILCTNFYYQKAEIDIIAQHDNMLICIEVKTRNSNFFGDPQDFVTPNKIKLLVKAMNAYILENDLNLEVRFDIIAVLKNKSKEEVTHFENAFYHF